MKHLSPRCSETFEKDSEIGKEKFTNCDKTKEQILQLDGGSVILQSRQNCRWKVKLMIIVNEYFQIK